MVVEGVQVAVLVVAGLVALGLSGALRWRAASRRLEAELAAVDHDPEAGPVDFRDLEGLPEPVARYLRTVLEDGRPRPPRVVLSHRGTFNLGGGRWRPFRSTQRVITVRPGFLWNARIALAPGLGMRVHDAYLAGEGVLSASLAGLFRVLHLRDRGPLAQGELMRYLAEAVWYPTALLPGHRLRWVPVDERNADAVLRDGPVEARLRFTFGDDGLVETVAAASRPRLVGGRTEPAPWQGRFWDWAERDGVPVPLSGEVAWLLADGPEPYWRGRLEAIDFKASRS